MRFLRNGKFKTMGLVVATKGEYSEKFNTRNNKIEYLICGTCWMRKYRLLPTKDAQRKKSMRKDRKEN